MHALIPFAARMEAQGCHKSDTRSTERIVAMLTEHSWSGSAFGGTVRQEIQLNSDTIPPIPMTSEGWAEWTVLDVVQLIAVSLSGPGNDDRVTQPELIPALDEAVVALLNQDMTLASRNRQLKLWPIEFVYRQLPDAAVWTRLYLSELHSSIGHTSPGFSEHFLMQLKYNTHALVEHAERGGQHLIEAAGREALSPKGLFASAVGSVLLIGGILLGWKSRGVASAMRALTL